MSTDALASVPSPVAPSPANEAPTIVDGRISGTRISVYYVYYYLRAGRTPKEVLEILPITEPELQVALDYIRTHEAEVREVHEQIETRIAKGNPPEIMAKLAHTRAKMQAWLEQHRQAKESGHEGHPVGQ